MPFVAAAENAALNAVTALITHIALLDATQTEIAGGSPAYARKPVTWGGAALGIDDNTGAIVFDVQSGDGVFFLGFTNHLTTGDGKTVGWWPAGGEPLQVGDVTASTDTITSSAHGLTTDNRVVFMPSPDGSALPSGLTEGVVYYVLASGLTANAFKVSTSSGGSSAVITTDGEVFFVECIPAVYAGQGTYTIPDGDLNITAAVV